jgi:hypothetical protein
MRDWLLKAMENHEVSPETLKEVLESRSQSAKRMQEFRDSLIEPPILISNLDVYFIVNHTDYLKKENP